MSNYTAETLASVLNGREYGNEISKAEADAARAAGLVVVYGYSDDNAEVEGLFCDEVGLYDGGSFRIDSRGVIPEEHREEWSDDEMFEYLARKRNASAVIVTGEWCPKDEPDLSWRFSASVPHSTFEIMEDGERFCIGIVFSLPTLEASGRE